MADLRVDIAAEFVGKKAFKQAETATSKLEKSVGKLGKQMLSVFAVSRVAAFGRASVKAFAEDEKAATRLAGVLNNLGLAFAAPEIDSYIESLSKATAVADDLLRPAFQALITTTGSLTQSQKLLAQAIDVSAGTGVDLATVANDLAQAYVGNTRGLRKYNLGLTQAELKAASFADIQERLTGLFSGQNAKYLATYSGQMQALTTASGEAKEVIGQGLIDALIALSGNNSVENLATDMDNVATYTANVIRGLGNLGTKLTELGGQVPNWLIQLGTIGYAGKVKRILDIFAKSGGTKQSTGFSFFGSPMEETQNKRNAAAAAKAERDAAKRAKLLADAQRKNTAELKKQNLAKKQSALFDMEQIQIIAALKGKITEEERLRLNLQLALITGNETEADKLSQKLANSIDQTGNLAKYLTTLPDANNPFKNWDSFLDAMIIKAREAATAIAAAMNVPQPANLPQTQYNAGTYVPSSGYVPEGNPTTLPSAGEMPNTQYNQGTYVPSSGYVAPANITVAIDGKAIADAIVGQQMNGNNAYLNRRLNGFD